MEDTDKENLHDGDANSTESISNSSIVSSGRRMLELFDDTALDEMEELLVVDIDLADEHEETAARRFKIHLKQVDWDVHVNYLVHTQMFQCHQHIRVGNNQHSRVSNTAVNRVHCTKANGWLLRGGVHGSHT
jgi:hypothetical protein